MWGRLLRRSLRVAVSLLVRTLPMFRTAQTLHNTNKASEQTTDLHRSLGTPRGGPLCNVAGAHRVAAADEEIPMQLLKLCYPNIPGGRRRRRTVVVKAVVVTRWPGIALRRGVSTEL